MLLQQLRYSAEETAQRGDEIYANKIRSEVEADNRGKVVAIDILTGAYAMDETALEAARRLRTQHPNAEVWLVRIGHRALHHIGARSRSNISG